MSYEVIHTFGFSVYLVLIPLFLWMSRVPRSNSGSRWWAGALGFALASRISMLLLMPSQDMRLIVTLYAALNLIEKPLLLTGLVRFLDLRLSTRWFWLATATGEFWLLLAWHADTPEMVRNMGFSVVNSALMASMAWLAWRQRDQAPLWMRAACASSVLLALHWLAGPLLIALFPAWFRYGFLLGTVLAVLQYLSLLAAALLLFRQRLEQAEANALEQAFLDPLTGLNNKRYMNTLFDQALLLATRPHHLVAIFYIDLDNFKPINDSAGHHVGDEVLKAVARRLKGIVRSTDICARVGGDEFIVIGTQLETEEQAFEVAKKLLGQLVQPVVVAEQDYSLGASIGISLYPEHARDLPQLIRCADSAMYQVKRNGKSGYDIYRAAPPDAAPVMA